MLASRHGPVPPAAVVAALQPRYGEPHRAYHDASHIAEVLGWYDRVGDEVGWGAPVDVAWAIWFHDAVYDPLAKDNEARSATLAAGHGASAYACDLIRLTARHGHLAPADVDRDAALFLDCDTAILGAAPAAFDAYDAAIRREYAAVPDAAFRAGRGAFLRGMLAQPRLFLSELFHAWLDGPARENLARILSRYG